MYSGMRLSTIAQQTSCGRMGQKSANEEGRTLVRGTGRCIALLQLSTTKIVPSSIDIATNLYLD
jgi:hypothetical protein